MFWKHRAILTQKKKKIHNIVFNKYHFLCNNWKKKLITSYMLFNKLILGKNAKLTL